MQVNKWLMYSKEIGLEISVIDLEKSLLIFWKGMGNLKLFFQLFLEHNCFFIAVLFLASDFVPLAMNPVFKSMGLASLNFSNFKFCEHLFVL